MPRPNDTRSQILDLAERLSQEFGWRGFSYGHIAEALGVKSAAIHYHFASKDELGTELVRRYRRRFAAWADRVEAEAGADPVAQLRAYIDIPRHFLNICPLGNLEANFNVLPEPMQAETRALGREMRSWLTRLLVRGRDHGAFRYSGSASDRALYITAALQGASLLVRAEGSEAFERVASTLAAELVGGGRG